MSKRNRPQIFYQVFSFIIMLGLLATSLGPVSPVKAEAPTENTPTPTLVVIPGTIQKVLGCSGDWAPDCEKTALVYDQNSGLWQATFTLPKGSYEYKVALNGGWGENYGLNAKRDGPNIPLVLGVDTAVTFIYDHNTHWVADSANQVIATVIGSFQKAIGCSDNSQPNCLRSWLQDPDGDGTYTFTTTAIPAGSYDATVAINQSMNENYGADGALNGASIPFTVPQDGQEIYFAYDSAKHLLAISTTGTPRGDIRLSQAHWIQRDTIAWKVVPPAEGTKFYLHFDPAGKMKLEPGVGITGGQKIELKYTYGGLNADVVFKYPNLNGLDPLKINQADLVKVPEILKCQIAVSMVDKNGRVLDATALQIPVLLDELYTYTGPLGVTFDGDIPTLRLWAPTAQKVVMHLYDDSKTDKDTAYPMYFDPTTGVWVVTGDTSWKFKYYLYEVQVWVQNVGQLSTNIVTDPYSLSLAMNSTRSQIVDLADQKLKPEGWDTLQKPPLDAPEDIVLYELHVRDFSIHDQTVPTAERGTFKAFTELNSNGMQHLKALAEAGLTHIHLLPVFDIASVDEDKSKWVGPDEALLATFPADSDKQAAEVGKYKETDGFNWGYDPFHYTTPEGSYSTNPDGYTRIIEFRQMVQALSQTKLRVVMDVVYNHTNASGVDKKSVLDKVVPGYYHRLNKDGQVETSTCCQNTATEHNMMEKLMIDSVVTWAKYYKVDGFRFDLMGHHMLSNMVHVRQALDNLTLANDGVDGSKIYIYGEGWDFGEVAKNARGVNATQLNLGGTGIGTFNDRLRDAARGGGPFNPVQEQGFLNGLFVDPSAFDKQGTPEEQRAKLLHYEDLIRIGLAGNLKNYQFVQASGKMMVGSKIDYNGSPAGYTLDPQENIVYVSAHDNETLFDAIQNKAPAGATIDDRTRMQNLGLDLVLLAQGVPFFHAGDDMLRSKSLDGNSYNSGDWFNKLDFTYAMNNWGVGLPNYGKDRWPYYVTLLGNPALKPSQENILSTVAHFREMLQIRKSSPLFRLRTEADVIARLSFLNTGADQIPGLIAMVLDDTQGGDIDPNYEKIVVGINATQNIATLTDGSLKGLALELHPVQQNSADPLVKTTMFDTATGSITIPGRTSVVFVLKAVTAEPTVTPLPANTAVSRSPTANPPFPPTATNMPPTAVPPTTVPTATIPPATEVVSPTQAPSSTPAATQIPWAFIAGFAIVLLGGGLFLWRRFSKIK